MALLSILIALCNLLGGAVAIIWLAILGEWGTLLRGGAAVFVGIFGIGIAVLPALIFAGPATLLQNRGERFGSAVLGFLGLAYVHAVMMGWCLGVLIFLTRRANAETFIPTALLSYTVAVSVLAFLAQKDMDAGNGYGGLSTFFAQLGLLVSLATIFVFNPPFLLVVAIFALVMLVSVIFQTTLVLTIESRQ